jgi:hypothetical protein
MNPMGLLMALMEPEAGTQDEFDDWYDLEHIPHMSGVAGILRAQRFVAVEGWPRYAALYDLDSVGVLTSAPYRAVTGRSFSPWSRRILQRVRGWRRLTFEQRAPGRSPLHPAAGAIGVLFLNEASRADEVAKSLHGRPELLQVRTYGPAAADGPAAVVWEAGSLAALGGIDQTGAAARGSVWSARLALYSRRDPAAAFARLEAEQSP